MVLNKYMYKWYINKTTAVSTTQNNTAKYFIHGDLTSTFFSSYFTKFSGEVVKIVYEKRGDPSRQSLYVCDPKPKRDENGKTFIDEDHR